MNDINNNSTLSIPQSKSLDNSFTPSTSKGNKSKLIIFVFLVLLFVSVALGVFLFYKNYQLQKTTLAPSILPTPTSQTNTENVQLQLCSSSDFDINPNVDELLQKIDEQNKVRIIIDTLSGDKSTTTGHVSGHTYTLEGVDFKEEDHGRLVEFIGQGYHKSQYGDPNYFDSFKVGSYKMLPLSVLDGKIKVQNYCRRACSDYYLFDTTYKNKTYTFTLSSQTINLSGLIGQNARLAGVVGFEDIVTPNRFFFVKQVCD